MRWSDRGETGLTALKLIAIYYSQTAETGVEPHEYIDSKNDA